MTGFALLNNSLNKQLWSSGKCSKSAAFCDAVYDAEMSILSGAIMQAG